MTVQPILHTHLRNPTNMKAQYQEKKETLRKNRQRKANKNRTLKLITNDYEKMFYQRNDNRIFKARNRKKKFPEKLRMGVGKG